MAQYLYFDTSALVKIVRNETASDQVVRLWKDNSYGVCASELVITELLRAVRDEERSVIGQARQVLTEIALISIERTILEKAAHLDPTVLRPLDAIHVATALELGEDLAAVVTFDDRMAVAARTCGLTVLPRPETPSKTV
ncbi:MAG: type II toxin-antitoxin system VapC family toxin [Propionibacteriaceae bacterium]|jgi:predicted nucleic acid-binding protein|nr:type II toxin-antitoxin system VapC family toxin [Propionibacteriaceae bacterium]